MDNQAPGSPGADDDPETEMDSKSLQSAIQSLESAAYHALLRAFRARSGNEITWEQADVMQNLRQELHVSNDQHKQYLHMVKEEDAIQNIRSEIPVNIPPTSRPPARRNRTVQIDQEALVGREIKIRWPEDDEFLGAYIGRYNHFDGRHQLLYDRDTENETYEWVKLEEIPSEDIIWVEREAQTSHQGSARESLVARPVKSNAAARSGKRKRETTDSQFKAPPPIQIQEGAGRKFGDVITLRDTQTVVDEVERVFSSTAPDPREAERARITVREQEASLVNAIARIDDILSDDAQDREQAEAHEPEPKDGEQVARKTRDGFL